MPKYFKEHEEWALGAGALVFVLIFAGYFFVGIRGMLRAFEVVVQFPEEGAGVSSFDIEGARALNVKATEAFQGFPQVPVPPVNSTNTGGTPSR